AGKEAQPLARLDRGPREDDPLDLLGLERLHRHRHREPRLAGTRGADPKRDDVAADRLDVAYLAGRLGTHVATLRRPEYLVREHLGRAVAVVDHADRAGDRALVELVPALEQADELLEQAPHTLGIGATHRDLVAAHDDGRIRELLLDLPQVGVARPQ